LGAAQRHRDRTDRHVAQKAQHQHRSDIRVQTLDVMQTPPPHIQLGEHLLHETVGMVLVAAQLVAQPPQRRQPGRDKLDVVLLRFDPRAGSSVMPD